jgi:hypothetical protein
MAQTIASYAQVGLHVTGREQLSRCPAHQERLDNTTTLFLASSVLKVHGTLTMPIRLNSFACHVQQAGSVAQKV